MSNTKRIQGKYCCLDLTEYKIDESWAQELVAYFDNKLPLIIDLIKNSRCPNCVYIFIKKDYCAPGKIDDDKMQFTPNPQHKSYIKRGNKGFLIHEGTHFVQSYGQIYFDHRNNWVAEGIADYARIKLGWDNADLNEYPCSTKHPYTKCSRCAADFLMWINQKFFNEDFIIRLNKSLQNNQGVDPFLRDTLNTTVEDLYSTYKMSEILGKITDFYVNSGDFNGMHITSLGENFKEIRPELRKLLEEKKIILNFGDRHPNPHILAFEPESIEEQIEKLGKLKIEKPEYRDHGILRIQTNSVSCCVYPSRNYLQSKVDRDKYKDRPFTLLLALGEPQLSYRGFNLRVLEFYRNDPRYSFDTNDIQGHISSKSDESIPRQDDTFLQTFGFAYDREVKNRYVAVYLRYLSDLTPEHQQRWKLEEFTGETFLHPDYARTSAGHWPERESMFVAFCEEIRIINEIANMISGKPLFRKAYNRENKPRKFGFLTRPTREEYENFVHLLDKMIADNLNRDFFEDKVSLTFLEEKDGVTTKKQKGTISLLKEWLGEVKLDDPSPFIEMIEDFQSIHNERHPVAHRVGDDEWDNKYFCKQRELMMKAYGAIRTLRLILANHPRAKKVKVPDWLFDGKIWTY